MTDLTRLNDLAATTRPRLRWSRLNADITAPGFSRDEQQVTVHQPGRWTMSVDRQGTVLVRFPIEDPTDEHLRAAAQEAGILHHLLSGRLVLHGSAVEIHGRALCVIGAGGAGKSTTAHAAVELGARLLADDVIAFGPGPSVLPGDSSVRLGTDRRHKEPVAVDRVSENSVRLGAIVALQRGEQFAMRRLHGLEAFEVVRHSGGGTRGLTLMGPSGYVQAIGHVVNNGSVWELERPTEGVGPQALVGEIVRRLGWKDEPPK